MRDYEEFKSYIKEHITEYLPEEYQSAAISFVEVTKSNDFKVEGISIASPWSKLCPRIDLQDIYTVYRDTDDIDAAMRDIAEKRVQAEEGIKQLGEDELITNLLEFDYESIKDKVYPRIINRQMNEGYLKNKAYRNMQDLAIVYYVRGENEEHGYSVTITDDMLENLQVSEEELYQQSKQNLKKSGELFLFRFKDPEEIDYDELLGSNSLFALIESIQIEDLKSQNAHTLIGISNKSQYYGAAMLCDTDLLRDISENIGQDLVIFPSSIHEVLITGIDMAPSAEEAQQMIQAINTSEVMEIEVLSNHAYAYSPKGHEIMTLQDYERMQMEKDPMKEVLRRTAECRGERKLMSDNLEL